MGGRGRERETERLMENIPVLVLGSGGPSRSSSEETRGITAELDFTYVPYQLATSIFQVLDNPLSPPMAMI